MFCYCIKNSFSIYTGANFLDLRKMLFVIRRYNIHKCERKKIYFMIITTLY